MNPVLLPYRLSVGTHSPLVLTCLLIPSWDIHRPWYWLWQLCPHNIHYPYDCRCCACFSPSRCWLCRKSMDYHPFAWTILHRVSSFGMDNPLLILWIVGGWHCRYVDKSSRHNLSTSLSTSCQAWGWWDIVKPTKGLPKDVARTGIVYEIREWCAFSSQNEL